MYQNNLLCLHIIIPLFQSGDKYSFRSKIKYYYTRQDTNKP